MANSKVILNGSTLMDVTTDTVAASNLLSGNTATKNDGTKVTGAYVPPSYSTQSKTGIVPTESSQSITPDAGYDGLSLVQINGISSTYVGTGVARKSSGDLTASGSTITAPAGYYSTAASKSIAAGSAFTPAVTITANPGITVNANGLITATVGTSSKITPTVTAGYIAAGTSGTVSATGTQTSQLTSVAATTYNVSTADRTIASQRWLVGAQTIKSVTTAGIAAANIKDGVTITVGDANDADRIAGVTGTFTDAATVSTGQQAATADKILNGFSAWVDGAEVKGTYTSAEGYTLTTIVPQQSVTVNSSRQSSLTNVSGTITDGEYYLVTYDGVQYITTCNVLWTNNAVIGDCAWCTGTTNDYIYPFAVDQVTAGTVLFAATASSQHTIKIEHLELNGGASTLIPKTVTAPGTYNASADSADGYSQVTVSLATQAAQTIYPSTATQTIASQKWLTGAQTIAAVTTTNLSANNIVSGVTVKVGDATNASRIAQIVGTATGGESYAPIYKSLAFRSMISSSDAFVSEWAAGMSQTKRGQFSNQPFDGDFYFTNLKTIAEQTFALVWDYGNMTHVSGSFAAHFPSVVTIGSCAFYGAERLTYADFSVFSGSIGNHVFKSCRFLKSISLPECKSIQTSAFEDCYSLETVYAPKVLFIRDNAFANCSALKVVNFPSCATAADGAFAGCRALSSVTLSSTLSAVNRSAFAYCVSLTSFSFGSVTSVGDYAFRGCSALSEANMPYVSSIWNSTFLACYSLSRVYAPLCLYIQSEAFGQCSSLNTVIIGSPSTSSLTISGYRNFGSCYNLLSLYVLTGGLATLYSSNAFTSTPISNYTTSTGGVYGSIFVPSSLFDAYISANNWSKYSSRFVSLTDAQISAVLSGNF